MKLSDRQRDTILAALRLWQWEQELGFEAVLATDRGRMIVDIAENGRGECLTNKEIDELCEELNV